MGEGFVDKDMETGGYYEQKMTDAMNEFFEVEPYKTMRNRFNVYTVKVVSPNAEFIDGAVHGLNDSYTACFDYARNVIKETGDDSQPMMITVIYNLETGIIKMNECQRWEDGSFIGWNRSFKGAIAHESGGHGFGGLNDEYIVYGYEAPEDYKNVMDNKWNQFGWGANIDWRNDKNTIKWAHILKDERYANEVGIYEGAYYAKGMYRPANGSIMGNGDGGEECYVFNAPSREAIYKRIMQLSEGESWKYDYEEFVKYDEINRKTAARSVVKPLTEAEKREYIKNHRPPTFIKGTWRDAMKNGKDKIVVPLR